ncbi:MAG: nucleotidyl transferase AbiEii/AbiGii toxin family protein [Gammaproteobacteria bacterium]|nr:nucleotidyl transferase AbiEii/AbiGii toxin family protein [Gammaproteobacteria bacterium]
MLDWTRPRHTKVMRILRMMNPGFLMDARCFFGGGTRIVMELGEYRRSDDIDFMVSDISGWRSIRSQITAQSLGPLFGQEPKLAREVRADRYGIRTFVIMEGEPIKLEIIHEGRHDLNGQTLPDWPVPVMGWESLMAQKLMATADRGLDKRFHLRDLIDLAFMVASWGNEPFAEGMEMAENAYGKSVRQGLVDALRMAVGNPAHWRTCLDALDVNVEDNRLMQGLSALNALCEHPIPQIPSDGIMATGRDCS